MGPGVDTSRPASASSFSSASLSVWAAMARQWDLNPQTTLTRLLPRGILEHKKQVAADHIPTRKRGIADAKINVALSGRVDMSKHEKWRGDGIDLRLACNCYHTYQQAIDAAKACVRGQVPDAIPGLAQVTNAFDPSMSPPGRSSDTTVSAGIHG